jgi:hypothetical protein
MHVYEIRPRKDHRGFDLISDALPFGRAPKDQSNRRKRLPDYAVWEIYPTMKLKVQ